MSSAWLPRSAPATARAIAGLDVVPGAAIVDGTWDFVSPHVGHVERLVKPTPSAWSCRRRASSPRSRVIA